MMKFNGVFTLARPIQKSRLMDFFLTRRTVEETAGDFDVDELDEVYPEVAKRLEKFKRKFVNGRDVYREDCVENIRSLVEAEWRFSQRTTA